MDANSNAVKIFDLLADVYQAKYMDVSQYADSLDLLCSILDINAKIIELACGPGNVTRYLLDKRPDLKIEASDLSENMLRIASKINPEATFRLMDCRKIDDITEKCDAVVCAFGLPYLSKAEACKLIKDAAGILNKNGLIFLSTMEDDHSKSKMERSSSGHEIFMNYHEQGYLEEAMRKSNFGILYSEVLIYNDSQGKDVRDLILIGRQEMPEK